MKDLNVLDFIETYEFWNEGKTSDKGLFRDIFAVRGDIKLIYDCMREMGKDPDGKDEESSDFKTAYVKAVDYLETRMQPIFKKLSGIMRKFNFGLVSYDKPHPVPGQGMMSLTFAKNTLRPFDINKIRTTIKSEFPYAQIVLKEQSGEVIISISYALASKDLFQEEISKFM